MKIAILGSRGLPLDDLSFGGFEAFIAGLAPRLAQAGHDVTVYCRRDLYRRRPLAFGHVRLRYVPSIEHKALGTPIHMTLCAVDAVFRRYDAILVVNSGNGLQCGLLRLASGARLALNMDGVEWQRGKWGTVARAYFKFASRWGARIVHAPIVDSVAVGELYRREFGIGTIFIPYAVDLDDSTADDKVREIGLTPGDYGLVVGRLIPENFTDLLIEGFKVGLPGKRLVVVGGANYESEFHRRIRAIAGADVRLLGHVHDQDLLRQLFANSHIYLHGHSVGGTNPALLQALAAGCVIAAHEVVFNREVVGEFGRYFQPTVDSIAHVARELWDAPPDERARLRQRARARVGQGGYAWHQVVAAYEAVLTGRRSA